MERIRVPRPYREIGKPLAVRMVELLRALQLIFDSILAVRTGRLQHLISLSGQLRALLTERSSKADRLIDWSAPRHLQASVTIDEDLTTLLELVIDGERVGRSRVPQPLFVLSDPMHYDSYHNRAVDGKEQDFSFGVIEVVMYGSEVPPVGRANLLLHFEEIRNDPELPIIAYTPRSYGHAPRGTKNLSMTGLVKHLKVRDLLPDFDPKRQSILTDAGTPIQQND